MWHALTKYHPRIGYTFMPSVKSRVPWENGGYLLRTNAAGFRSEREFIKERTLDKFRAVLFGDSQTAGNGVSNLSRYSDVVEQLVPNLEVYNYALPGTSADQHYLTYQDCADVDHDLVIVGMHIHTITRIPRRFMMYHDANDQEVVFAKPYFSLSDGALTLHHIPVPKEPITKASVSPEDAPYVDWGTPLSGLKKIAIKLGVRDLVQKATKRQPVPEYNSPDHPTWLLLRTILQTWIRECKTPVLLFLLPMWAFIEESSDPTNYLARFRELARETGCHVHDPLPDLWRYPLEERRTFRFPVDSHFTPQGHQAFAASLAPAIERIRSEQRT